MRLLAQFIAIYLLFSISVVYAASAVEITQAPSLAEETCEEVELKNKDVLKGGWSLKEPYQFNIVTPRGFELVGMDIEIVNALAAKARMSVSYEEVLWKQHQLDLENGDRDIAWGASYTDERAEYALFSIPYRLKANSLFMLNSSKKTLIFTNIRELLAQIKLQDYKLGVVNGSIYSAPEINTFIADKANKDIIIKFDDSLYSFQALMRGEIDGFLCDRVIGASIILSSNIGIDIKEIPINVKTAAHLMFSKKTVPVSLVEKFNIAINDFINSKEYKNIERKYLHPVLLLQTSCAHWFHTVILVGAIAFALSGIAIAIKESTTLFGGLIFAILPTMFASTIVNNMEMHQGRGILAFTASYIYFIIAVVLTGFIATKLFYILNRNAENKTIINVLCDNLIIIGDAIGQATFIVTGVVVAVISRFDPIELWGPLFAFVVASSGSILRDLIRKERIVSCVSEKVNTEISLLWGFAFSIFLSINSSDPNLDEIKCAVLVVIIGAFVTRLFCYYRNITNLRFR